MKLQRKEGWFGRWVTIATSDERHELARFTDYEARWHKSRVVYRIKEVRW